MEKEFIPYPEALALKELGFDEPCFGYYDTEGLQFGVIFWWNRESKNSLFVEAEKTNNPKISAPTYSQAFRFFREKYNLHCWVGCKTLDNGETVYIGNGRTIPNTLSNGFIVDIIPYEPKPTPEEAELACLRKLIELVKTK